MEFSTTRALVLLLGIFLIQRCVLARVNVAVRVLNFDMSHGPSHGDGEVILNLKCCGTLNAGCNNVHNSCVIFFRFCIGSLDNHGRVCSGVTMDTRRDVSRDVIQTYIDTWDTGNMAISVQVFQCDGTSSVCGVESDVTDEMTLPLNFEPDSSYWRSSDHQLTFINRVSLDIGLLMWCGEGWYGRACERKCSQQDDNFHTCQPDGTVIPVTECTYTDTQVVSLEKSVAHLGSLPDIWNGLFSFIADTCCPPRTSDVNLTVIDIREHGNVSDIVFTASCNDVPVSSFKIQEILYIWHTTDSPVSLMSYYFGADVDLPEIQEFAPSYAVPPRLIMMVRIPHFSSDRELCPHQNPTEDCLNIGLEVRFQNHEQSYMWPNCFTSPVNFTDGKGKMIYFATGTSFSSDTNCTAVFFLQSLSNFSISIHDFNSGGDPIAEHIFDVQKVQVGSDYLDAFPYQLPVSEVNKTRMILELIAWCDSGFYGDQCEHELDRDSGQGLHERSCGNDAPCINGKVCINNTFCACAKGWHGPTCSIDIDECYIGMCMHASSCYNLPGSYMCTCKEGFSGLTCADDVDECASSPCSNGGLCLNTYGSFNACVYETGNDGQAFEETVIDPCNSNPCSNGTICTKFSNDAGFACVCKQGHKLNGTDCTDVDECTVNGHSPCQHNGTCTNSIGSYFCSCTEGYIGQQCIHMDVCTEERLCHLNETCNSTESHIRCPCDPGMTGSNCTSDIDECAIMFPCHNGGSCTNSVGNFTCNCTLGWKGWTCSEQDGRSTLTSPQITNKTITSTDISTLASVFPSTVTSTTSTIAFSSTSTIASSTSTTIASSTTSTIAFLSTSTIASSTTSTSASSTSTIASSTTSTIASSATSRIASSTTRMNASSTASKISSTTTSTIPYSTEPTTAALTKITYPTTKILVSTFSTSTMTLSTEYLDVFSLQFKTVVSEVQYQIVREGFIQILQLFKCHDPSDIEVNNIQNSVTKPNVVEIHAKCGTNHFTNEEINDFIHTLSDSTLRKYFHPLELAYLGPEKPNWILIAAGGGVGGVALIIIIIVVVCMAKRKKKPKNTEFTNDMVEVVEDMDGKRSVRIHNPVYNFGSDASDL